VARPHIAHAAVLAMALWLFWKADSATSIACFLLGSGLIVLSIRYGFASKPAAVHILTAGIVSLCLLGLFVDSNVGIVQAMGRDPTLTGRTQLWEELLRMTADPWFGTGFESFWLGERATWLWQNHWWHPNQAHNGYLEVFLSLGWLGIALLSFTLVWGYRNAVGAVHLDPETGSLKLAYFVVAVIYNLTEAAFKGIHPVWIVFLLAVTVVPEPSRREDGLAEAPQRSIARAATT